MIDEKVVERWSVIALAGLDHMRSQFIAERRPLREIAELEEVRAEILRRIDTKPAPARGAEAAIEAIREALGEEKAGLFSLGAYSMSQAPFENRAEAHTRCEAIHAKLRAALAALRGEKP